MKDLSGKIVVITGAGSGIGRALAQGFAKHSVSLALCDSQADSLAETARLCGSDHILTAQVDVSDRQAMEAFARSVEAELGPADVLINNAGVSLIKSAAEPQADDMRWLMDINYWGVVHGCESFLPQMLRQSEAQIVNVSSIFGLMPQPMQAAYCASKAAVNAYSESLRFDLKSSNVKVTTIIPGGVKTNIVRSSRVGFKLGAFKKASSEEMAADFERLALTSADQAAKSIIKAIRQNRKRSFIGPDAKLVAVLSRLIPHTSANFLANHMQKRMSQQVSKIQAPMPRSYTDQGQGPVVVLLNGLSRTRHHWYGFDAALAKRFRVVSIDLPGAGDAEQLATWSTSVSKMANYVLESLDQLGIERAHIIGSSLGGMVAMACAQQDAKRCSSVSLINSSIWGSGRRSPRISWSAIWLIVKNLGHRPDIDRICGQITDLITGPACSKLERQQFADFQANLMRTKAPGVRGFLMQILAAARFRRSTALDHWNVPTAIIYGSHDRFVPSKNSLILADILPKSELFEIREGGHELIYDKGQELLQIQVDWLLQIEMRLRQLDGLEYEIDTLKGEVC